MEAKREALLKIRNHEGTIQTFGPEQEIDLDDDDDSSVNTSSEATNFLKKTGNVIADTGGKHFDGWKPKYRIPCSAITVESQHKTSVHVLVRVQNVKQEREFLFDTVEDANTFCATLDEERQIEKVRAKTRLDSALGDIKLAPFERLSLLFEIVSGWDLPIGDMTTSDPYIVCILGHREVHRTKHISST